MSETRSLKALADAVLRRDTPRDDRRDKVSHAPETRDGSVRRPESRSGSPPTATPPTDTCLACDTSAWFLVADWPTPGTSRGLCRTCTSRPSPSLRNVAAGLSDADGTRLGAEAAD